MEKAVPTATKIRTIAVVGGGVAIPIVMAIIVVAIVVVAIVVLATVVAAAIAAAILAIVTALVVAAATWRNMKKAMVSRITEMATRPTSRSRESCRTT